MRRDEEQKGCPPARREAPLPRDEIAENERLAELTKALGHPARVAIVRLLLRRETCICGGIVDVLPLAQSTVSQHLRVLKRAGVIRGEVEGPRVCYCADRSVLDSLSLLLRRLLQDGPPDESANALARCAPTSDTEVRTKDGDF